MPPAQTELETSRTQLRDFATHYQYDTGYLEQVLEQSPAGFQAFGSAQGLSLYRSALSIEAHFVARVAVMLADDCGACTQLNLRMAVEQGVERDLLQRLLDGGADLPPLLGDVAMHVRAVVAGQAIDLERVQRLRDGLGDEAFAELALTITGSRIYPSLKRALGQMGTCAQPHLDF